MHHFLIEPKDELIQEISKSPLDEDDQCLLQWHEYWHTRPGTDPHFVTLEDELSRLKLTYLAHLYSEYIRENPPEWAEVRQFFLAVLDSPPWGIATFDRWWNIEVLELECDIYRIQNELVEEDLRVLRSPESQELNAWLAELTKRKSSK